jgi:hypothetical protein
LKPLLSIYISQEQFSFIKVRLIHESIGVAQEGLHTIKKKNTCWSSKLIYQNNFIDFHGYSSYYCLEPKWESKADKEFDVMIRGIIFFKNGIQAFSLCGKGKAI